MTSAHLVGRVGRVEGRVGRVVDRRGRRLRGLKRPKVTDDQIAEAESG